jgi:hypothetical protein
MAADADADAAMLMLMQPCMLINADTDADDTKPG